MSHAPQQRIPGYCALCKSRCGCISVVEDGRLVAVEPDPAHPTGAKLCAKGRAAPEIVHNPDRLRHPLKRTRPKGAADPGWQRISWDEALDATAAHMARIAAEHGPEAVAFAVTTPSGTGMSDHVGWVRRLSSAYGSPNTIFATEICNWHKDHASEYTIGSGIGTPDYANAGCILLWGHNPSTGWLSQATMVADARARGARLVVVDPRRAGAANKADQWLRVRPGTDGALALAIAGEMIRNGAFDRDFIARWSTGAFLVRADTGHLLAAADLGPDGDSGTYVAWDTAANTPLVCDPARPDYFDATAGAALDGRYTVATTDGPVECAPAFALYADLCDDYPPERAEAITGVPAEQVRAVARLLWEARPVAFYAWSGVGQHSNATQTARALNLLNALTGGLDAPGGNLMLRGVPANDVWGDALIDPAQKQKALGLAERPLGPARGLWVTAQDFRRAAVDGAPYRVRGLLGFGSNLLLSQPDPAAMRAALQALDFHVQADLVMTPTAALADIVLPVSSPWEHAGLRVGFETGPEGMSWVQWRQQAIAPLGAARSDSWIAFQLAERLGLGNSFFGGSLEDGWRHVLEPSGVTLEDLQARPGGMRVPVAQQHRKYAGNEMAAPGFNTPSRRVEIYAQSFLDHGQDPLPRYVEPAVGPVSRPDLAARYPLVLTSAKTTTFCHSQHRGVASLRRLQRDPEVQLHPDAAAARGIANRDWVRIETPNGAARARARFNAKLDPGVVCAQHGWWQACEELGLDGYAPDGPDTANYNAMISDAAHDPISGSVPLRSYLCEVRAG